MAERRSSPARRASPARSPRGSSTAIRASSSAASRRARDAGRRLDDLYPHHRVAAVLEELDLDRHARRRRRDRRLPARRRGAGRRRAARARRAGSSTSAPTSACATAATYERWYVRARRARAARRGRLRPARAATASEIASADLVANPGCFPTAALLALAPLARAGLIADVVIDAKTGRLAAPGARRPTTTHFVSVDENVKPYKVGATATRRRSTRSSPRSARRVPIDVHAAPRAARPGRADVLLRHADRAGRRRRARELYEEAYADEPFVELVDAPAGRARRARDEHLPHPRPRRRAHRAR